MLKVWKNIHLYLKAFSRIENLFTALSGCCDIDDHLASFTSIKSTKQQSVSQSVSQLVTDKHSQWSDSGPIKIQLNLTALTYWDMESNVANVHTSVCEVCGLLHGVTTKPPSSPLRQRQVLLVPFFGASSSQASFRQGSLSIRRRALLVRGAATKRLTRERELPLHEWSRQHNTN